MLRVFSGSCLSLDHMDTVTRSDLIQQKHLLGPGVDYFTPEGKPVQPHPGVEELQRVFSGSALDLNAMAEFSDDDPVNSPCVPVSTILHQMSQDGENGKALRAKSKTQVLVFGDNAYIATNVVGKLLMAGYTVRVCLSDSAKQAQYSSECYTANPEVAQRLSIVLAEMTNENVLSHALKGCRYVIHCGCSISGSKNNIISYHEKSIKALFAAIRMCGSSTIRRLLITGAYTSVFHLSDPDPPSGMFDESCWNRVVSAEEDPAVYAKVIFEQEAWRLQRVVGVELVVLLPSIPIGLSRTAETGESMQIIQDLAHASFPFCPDLYWNFVDVQDVAEGHLRALEHPNLHEARIIISSECLSIVELSRLMKKVCPRISPPTRTLNKFFTILAFQLNAGGIRNLSSLWNSLGIRKELDNKVARESLGMTFTPVERTLAECLERIVPEESPNEKARGGTACVRFRCCWGKLALGGLVGVVVIAGFIGRRCQRRAI